MEKQMSMTELSDTLRACGIAPKAFSHPCTFGVTVLAFDCTPDAELYLAAKVTARLPQDRQDAFVNALYRAQVLRGETQHTVYFTDYRMEANDGY
jgi:hypothetical protein